MDDERARPKTMNPREIARQVAAEGPLSLEDKVAIRLRPRTRGDCANGVRPCPYVGCRHHLMLSVNEQTGSITLNFPDLELEELPETCSLDVAERGGITLETVGALSNLTRERIRQIEVNGLSGLRTGLSDEPSE